MKSRFNTALLALSGAVLLAAPAKGAVSLENSGLAIAFYSYTGSGPSAVIGANTYVFDLGAASLYRENTGYNVSVSTINSGIVSSNIGADLTAAFGANWANSGEVRWMVVGTNSSLGTVGDDPSRTSYYSVARNNFATTTSFFGSSPMLGSLLASSSGQIGAFAGNTQNEISATNVDGTITPSSDLFSIDKYVAPKGVDSNLWFKIGTNITQTLGAGTIANGPDGLVFEGALDLYRVLDTVDGADLTAGYSGADAQARKGQYIGTLALDGAGNLTVIPEPSAALLGVLGATGACLRRRRRNA